VGFYFPGNYHPALPYKSNSKQMFLLCSDCADTMKYGNCTHTDERCIVGTWLVDKIRRAIEMVYS